MVFSLDENKDIRVEDLLLKNNHAGYKQLLSELITFINILYKDNLNTFLVSTDNINSDDQITLLWSNHEYYESSKKNIENIISGIILLSIIFYIAIFLSAAISNWFALLVFGISSILFTILAYKYKEVLNMNTLNYIQTAVYYYNENNLGHKIGGDHINKALIDITNKIIIIVKKENMKS